MAEAPTLGTFFKAKAKKKIKASNLNNAAATPAIDEKKKATKNEEDGVWEEETVVATTLKVEAAGKLMREEEKKDDEDTAAPAWGNISKDKKEGTGTNFNEKKFPSLAKSVGSSSINIDDGNDAKVNIATSKNHFAALEGDEDEDEEGKKRPTEIKPAMVQKKKGEREKEALKREVEKYTKKDSPKKKGKKESAEDDDEEEDEDEDEDEAPAEDEARKKKSPEKKDEKKDDKKQAKKPAQTEEEEDAEDSTKWAEDLKIQPDLVASKEKYKGRKKLPPQALPREELDEQKENKAKQTNIQPAGKKKKGFVVEEVEKKIQYVDS